jgi:hypothetical protein
MTSSSIATEGNVGQGKRKYEAVITLDDLLMWFSVFVKQFTKISLLTC